MQWWDNNRCSKLLSIYSVQVTGINILQGVNHSLQSWDCSAWSTLARTLSQLWRVEGKPSSCKQGIWMHLEGGMRITFRNWKKFRNERLQEQPSTQNKAQKDSKYWTRWYHPRHVVLQKHKAKGRLWERAWRQQERMKVLSGRCWSQEGIFK